MYQALAYFYDALVKDDEATQKWVEFIEAHAQCHHVIEYACGSGEITLALAKKGYQIEASDLSASMIQMAMKKEGAENVTFSVRDMRVYQEGKAECVLCLCDSMNYLTKEDDFKAVLWHAWKNLSENGTFIFDVHSLDRLSEFEEEFYEEGMIDDQAYEWSIETQHDCLIQNFVFFDEKATPRYEQHVQRVYDPRLLEAWCRELGFDVEIYTDFTQKGIHAGEKYFYVCRRTK